MQTLTFDCALLPQGWADNVAVSIDDAGDITGVETDVVRGTGERIGGCALPGVANLHSHAHQRAMAGLAERSGDSDDSFWTWRKLMYGFITRLQPHHLRAIAAQLYVEMLKSGYTSVAEFQYLHHDPFGEAYENVAEMSLQTLAAARAVGIGMTNLPVLYRYGGFGGAAPSSDQRRFLNDADRFLRIVGELTKESAGDRNVATGVAPHSLRAASKELLDEVLSGLGDNDNLPIHIHIAEQVKEVEDCIAWSGERPVAWLQSNFELDERWCLVHATHMTETETSALAGSGAVAGLCPTTEANLGDGLFNALQYIEEGGRLGVGSDSHISVSPVEELRWLEYGQRLGHLGRNVLAGGYNRSTGRHLFDLAVDGAAQACGRKIGRIETGRRADLVVIETDHPLLYGRRDDALLDSWIFSGNTSLVRHVFVGGRAVVTDGVHAGEEEIGARFRNTLAELSESI